MAMTSDQHNEIWQQAEGHWPVMVNRDRTRLMLIEADHRPEHIREQERAAFAELDKGSLLVEYELEPVREFYMMAYDPIRDSLFVRDTRKA